MTNEELIAEIEALALPFEWGRVNPEKWKNLAVEAAQRLEELHSRDADWVINVLKEMPEPNETTEGYMDDTGWRYGWVDGVQDAIARLRALEASK